MRYRSACWLTVAARSQPSPSASSRALSSTLLARGARRTSDNLTDGVAGATVGGRPVEWFTSCTDGSNWSYLNELRWLVEELGVRIVVGTQPSSQTAIRDYAKRHPQVAFMAALGGVQSATLRDPAPNFYRFFTDTSLRSAGLGAHAYHELGWREAAIVISDSPGSTDTLRASSPSSARSGARSHIEMSRPFSAHSSTKSSSSAFRRAGSTASSWLLASSRWQHC